MKKILVLILVVFLAGLTVACAKEKKEEAKPIELSQIADGTYLGKSGGITGVKVEVTVIAGKITRIEILKARGMPRYKKKALKEMPGRIVKAQSLKVEAVSGATKSSRSIIKAVENALRKALSVQGSNVE